MEITVRPAIHNDLPGVATIFNHYLGEASLALKERVAEDYADYLTAPRHALLVAQTDGKLQGYASIKPWSPRGGYVLAGEVSVFLGPAGTGNGVGSELYTRLLPLAGELGYSYLAARIMGDNYGSRRFHERFGFRLVGMQRGIGLVNGARKDTALYELTDVA